MSCLVAAGCARSRFQSVSVVPTIQWLRHGMTNSTDFSVRRIIPASATIRSRGTTMCTPLRGPHAEPAARAGEPLQFVRPDTGRVDHRVRPHVDLAAVLDVTHAHAGHPVRLAQEADHLGRRAHDGAVVGGGAADHHGVAGVVGLRVVVTDAADQRVALQRGHHPERARSGEVFLARHGRWRRPSCRTGTGRPRCTGAPRRGWSAGRGRPPASPGAVRCA